MIGQMREIANTAQRDTRRSRRERERRNHLKSGRILDVLKPPPDATAVESPRAAPFDDIEEW